ncbi:MAG TPA: DolP-mannose mannosyltransferase [Actinomycetota bacterium]|nr:DolP-mannose mannosyltransferase [Actinomycetota bacterium]
MRRLDPRWMLAGVLVLASIAFLAHGVDEALEHDEGVFVIASTAVADGALPYVEVFDNTGPLGPWVGGAGVALGRTVRASDVTSARAVYVPVALAILVMVFTLVRRMTGDAAIASIAVAALVALPAFSREALSGPRPKLLMIAFEIGALLALQRRRWFVAGVAVGLAALTWQVAAIVGIVAVAVAITSQRPARAAASVAAGVSTPVMAVTLVYVVAGRADTLWEGMVGWNLRYAWGSRSPRSIAARFIDPIRDAWSADIVSWPILALGILCVIVVAVACLRREGRMGLERPIVWVAALVVVWLVWTWIDEQSVADLLPLMPLAALGFAVGVDHVRRVRPIVVPVALAAIIAVAAIETVRTRDVTLVDQRRIVAAITRGRRLASYDGPTALALAGSRNPTRFMFEVPGLSRFLTEHDVIDPFVRELTGPDVDVVAARIQLDRTDPLERALHDALVADFEPRRMDDLSFWVRRA